MPDLLRDAVQAIKTGDKATGKALLTQLTAQDPSNEQAWLWMSGVVDSDKERIACLQKVLAINPNNASAQRGLQNLAAANKVNKAIPTAQPITPQPVPPPLPEQQDPVQVSPSQVADPKLCPYCAETIKAEAIYCRYCKRDLVSGQVSVANTADNPPVTLLDQENLSKKIQEYTQAGWIILNRTNDSVQLKKPRQWNQFGLVVFVALPLLCGLFLFPALIGFALVGFLIVIADYLLRKEELIYITAQQVSSSTRSISTNSFIQPSSNSMSGTTKDSLQKANIKKGRKKRKKLSSKQRLYIGLGILLLVLIGIVAAIGVGLSQVGFYSIQPSATTLTDGLTVVFLRHSDEPIFDSPDAFCVRMHESVTTCRAAALSFGPLDREIMRLPYMEWMYLSSTGGQKYQD